MGGLVIILHIFATIFVFILEISQLPDSWETITSPPTERRHQSEDWTFGSSALRAAEGKFRSVSGQDVPLASRKPQKHGTPQGRSQLGVGWWCLKLFFGGETKVKLGLIFKQSWCRNTTRFAFKSLLNGFPAQAKRVFCSTEPFRRFWMRTVLSRHGRSTLDTCCFAFVWSSHKLFLPRGIFWCRYLWYSRWQTTWPGSMLSFEGGAGGAYPAATRRVKEPLALRWYKVRAQ